MSDLDSIAYDAALSDYCSDIAAEKTWEAFTLQQCIYLFVEGETEENAIPKLLARCDLDTDKLGVLVASYNGIGNLPHALRLLCKTLSNDRPVIVTFDNDEKGKEFQDKLPAIPHRKELLTIIPLPSERTPIIYPSGHRGGSFEELFSSENFLNQVFSPDFMPEQLVVSKTKFLKEFKENSPWLEQVQKFYAENSYFDLKDYKVKLGMRLAVNCIEIPPDINHLVSIVKEVREKFPVRHPAS